MRGAVFLIAAFFLFVACGPAQLADYTSANQKVDSSIVSNSLDSMISPYRAELQKEMLQVIGYSDSDLVSYAPESPLSNFVADVVFERGMQYAIANGLPCEYSNTFCMLNFGGIRSVINKGEITTATIYELMPFDNTIVIAQLGASKVMTLLETLHQTKGQPLSNAKVILSENSGLLKIGGEDGDEMTDDVFIVTSDYLANGGDRMDFFNFPVKRWDTGILIRDVLIEYITSVKNIDYTPVVGRIIFE